jgi:hypothetical protein
MAGVKVTDLTTLATAANDDIMYIVDTSSNTSKQIEVQDIYSGMPQFASGEFTPVISDESGLTISVLKGIYSRVNDVVTMSLYLSVTFDVTGGGGSFQVALPVASTFATPRDCYGNITVITNDISDMTNCSIAADTATDKCFITMQANTGIDGFTFVAIIQYLVL